MHIKGFETGRPTKHGRLTLWPLEGPDHVGIGFVSNVKLKGDRGGYGSLQLGSDNGPAIGPWGMTFFFPGGQDRAIREAVYIQHEETVSVSAVCLEPRQGGTWQGQKVAVAMLPPSLRASLPAGGGYEALWDTIRTRNTSVGKEGDTVAGLLEGRVLDKDMAVSGMRGMVIALDGRPVAIEIAPTAAQFAEWWNDYGLGDTFSFEAETLPPLPTPIGEEPFHPFAPSAEGLHQVTAWDILRGWAYVQDQKLVYASLVDGEALVLFQKDQREGGRLDEWEVPSD